MKNIWKLPLARELGTTTYKVPKDAKLLDFQFQGNTPVVWIEVDPKVEVIEQSFMLLFTGDIVPVTAIRYVGTAQAPNGLVYHLYEAAKP